MMKRALWIILILLALFSVIFTIRQKDLVIHVSVMSKEPRNMIVKIDDEVLYEGKIDVGVYFGKKIVIEDFPIGIHSIHIEADSTSFSYSEDRFFLFNKTRIVNYSDSLSSGFWGWSKFGRYMPD